MNFLKYCIRGLGIGSFVYLCVLFIKYTEVSISRSEILSVFAMSILISITAAIIFKLEKLSYIAALLLHFIVVSFMVFIIANFNGWLSSGYTLFSYIVVIYFFSWLIVVIKNKITAHELNTILHNKK